MTYFRKKRVSIYCKGHRQSTSYYRIYQYFDHIEEIEPHYRVMMSKKFEQKYMPISKQPFYIKIYAYLYTSFRVLSQLLRDFILPPDIILVHKRFVSKFTPTILWWLIKGIKSKGVLIYWDIDDNIKGREISKKYFSKMAMISDGISVTHEFLRDTIDPEYRSKVDLLPTTDGDLYKLFSSKVNEGRLITLNDEVKLVWVATNVNLPHLISISSQLDKAAEVLKHNTGKTLSLTVVCNEGLNYNFKYLKLNNIKWTREVAIEQMNTSHVGIMPLLDNDFTRGKGGFKLVQYQSIGLPSIASNVGFNASVVVEGSGFLIPEDSPEQWIDAILALADPKIWYECSQKAYNNWNSNFSYEKNLNYWKKMLLKDDKNQ